MHFLTTRFAGATEDSEESVAERSNGGRNWGDPVRATSRRFRAGQAAAVSTLREASVCGQDRISAVLSTIAFLRESLLRELCVSSEAGGETRLQSGPVFVDSAGVLVIRLRSSSSQQKNQGMDE